MENDDDVNYSERCNIILTYFRAVQQQQQQQIMQRRAELLVEIIFFQE